MLQLIKNMSSKPKVLVIAGQTATGKSDLAVFLARKFNGEIISADSRQVYKNLDIGSGKITKKEMLGVKHHLLDTVSPKKIFSVSDFKKLAEEKIKEIINRKKIPIICGGTGFYISSITENILIPDVKPDNKLRKKLEKKDATELFDILKKLDKTRSENIDKNNKVRLIRAIEICKSIGKVPKKNKFENKFDFLKIGLFLEKEQLQNKIKGRLLKRIKTGMIKEVENLHKKGLSFKRMIDLGLEYRYISLFLQKKMSKHEMIEKLNTEIYQYAKRQMTWFKRDKEILWFKPEERERVKNKVKEFLI